MKIRNILLALLMLPLSSCAINDNNENNVIDPNQSITIKQLRTGTDDQNHDYKVFGYEIYPSSAFYKSITAEITFADNRNNGSRYLISSVNNEYKEVTVTCLEAFDSIATLTISPEASNVSVSIEIHYKQKRTLTMFGDKTVTLSSGSFSNTSYHDYNPSFYSLVRECVGTTKGIGTDPVGNFELDFINGPDAIGADRVYLGAAPSNRNISAEASFSQVGTYAMQISERVRTTLAELNLNTKGPAGDAYAGWGSSTSIMQRFNSMVEYGLSYDNDFLTKLKMLFYYNHDSEGYLPISFKLTGREAYVLYDSDGTSVIMDAFLTVRIPNYWNLQY